MTKSKLITTIARKQAHMTARDVEVAIALILDHVAAVVADGGRVEIRDFGVFALRRRPSRLSRNPKNGDPVLVPEKNIPYFKPGRDMRARVNARKR